MKFPDNIKVFIKSFFDDKTIEKTSSQINPYLEIKKEKGKYILNSKNVNYSYGGLHKAFQKIFKKINLKEEKIKDVLILGFGAGSIASILLDEYKFDCQITGVEKDLKVIELAKKYFEVEKFSGLKIHIADANDFLLKNKNTFDLVIVDLYIDYEVPPEFETIQFLKNLKEAINTDGLLIFNKLIYNHSSKKSAIQLVDRFNEIFGEIDIYKIRNGLTNWMLVYKKHSISFVERK